MSDPEVRPPARRLRYQDVSAEARELLASEGESDRFEFKEKADAVKGKVLVAAANAVVLERIASGYVTILVGVKEVADELTGVVRGEVIGLTGMNDSKARRASIEKARQSIQSTAAETYPIPVGLRIIEEGVDTTAPFLRLEVWPTRAPHYTRDGMRVTRAGASTRAITDDELVEMYLAREAEIFRQRFSDITAELARSIEDPGESVRTTAAQIVKELRAVEDSAAFAGGEASEAASTLRDLEMQIQDLPTADELVDWLEQGERHTSRVATYIIRRVTAVSRKAGGSPLGRPSG
ncbi:hypothetical protein [Actinoplanes sp. NPDC048796]|uniref:hypothetical protein n=1 Tax=Actinoplanes sp. NPDC048796 TaxID=3155640 RepID=UPI0033F79E7B